MPPPSHNGYGEQGGYGGQSGYGSQEGYRGQGDHGSETKEKGSGTGKMLAAGAGGLAVGAIGGAIIAHEMSKSMIYSVIPVPLSRHCYISKPCIFIHTSIMSPSLQTPLPLPGHFSTLAQH